MSNSILILGGWSYSEDECRPIMEAAPEDAACRFVHLPDLSPPLQQPNATLPEQLGRHLEGHRFDLVVGWSLGAMLGLDAVCSGHLETESMLLFAASPRFMASPGHPNGWSAQDLQDLRTGLKKSSHRTLRAFRRRCGDRRPPRLEPTWSLDELLKGLDYLEAYDITPSLKQLDLPITLVHGDRDRIVHPSGSDLIYQSLPQAHLIRIPNGSHTVCLDTSQPLHTYIQQTLDQGRIPA